MLRWVAYLMRILPILLLLLFIACGCSPSASIPGSLAVTRNTNDTWTSDAIQRGDFALIRQRVLNDPDYLTTRDSMGNTPLLTAITFDDSELVQFLLQNGADPNVSVDDGYTCLLTAIESESDASREIVSNSISAGADIQRTGTNGWTPLHMAAARGDVAKAKLLIDAGAQVNQRTKIDAEETPLMEAAFLGQPETVQLLLDHGADASMRDVIHNRTPLEIAQAAADGPDPNVYNFLKEENIQIDVDELFAETDLTPEQLAMLKQSLDDLDMAENYVQNSKEIAATGNHAEVIRILTEHAAKP